MLLLVLACLPQLVASCDDGALVTCQSYEEIASLVGQSACQSKRIFYNCMRTSDCYYTPDGCIDDFGEPASCEELCEQEPMLYTCVDPVRRNSSEEDFHLCPHITKPAVTATLQPSDEDVLSAPSASITMTAWTSHLLSSESVDPSTVVPALWPGVVKNTFAEMFGYYPAAVVVETPVEYRRYPVELPDSPPPPEGTEHTSFIIVHVHAVQTLSAAEIQTELDNALVGEGAPRVPEAELGFLTRLNASLPPQAGFQMHDVDLYVQAGRALFFPGESTTSTTTTTTSMNPLSAANFWRAWRLRCLEGVVYRWEVHEVEFWVDGCPWEYGFILLHLNTSSEDGAIVPTSSGAIDGYPVFNAFDGLSYEPSQPWYSDCRGCVAGQPWIAIDGGPGRELEVSCVVVRQSQTATNQCHRIAVEASRDPSNESLWHVRVEGTGALATVNMCVPRLRSDFPELECGFVTDGCYSTIQFGDCPGGNQICEANMCQCPYRKSMSDAEFVGWQCGIADDGCGRDLDFGNCSEGMSCQNHYCKGSEPTGNMWRLVCNSGTVDRWWIHEIEFHTDAMCLLQYEAFTRTITAGSRDELHVARKAFDRDDSTYWSSRCQGCEPDAAWIGLEFGEPVSITCVVLKQGDQNLQQCAQITLEYSDDGVWWTQLYRYGFGGHVLRSFELLQADMDERMDDEGDLHVSERMAPLWRLKCIQALTSQWGVFELTFFDDDTCSSSLRPASVKVLHSRSTAWPASNAVDARLETIWKSDCGIAGDPCNVGEVFLGVEFEKYVYVGCVKVVQLEPGSGGCSALALQFASEDEDDSWVTRTQFNGVGAQAILIPPRIISEETSAVVRNGVAAPLLVLCVGLARALF